MNILRGKVIRIDLDIYIVNILNSNNIIKI